VSYPVSYRASSGLQASRARGGSALPRAYKVPVQKPGPRPSPSAPRGGHLRLVAPDARPPARPDLPPGFRGPWWAWPLAVGSAVVHYGYMFNDRLVAGAIDSMVAVGWTIERECGRGWNWRADGNTLPDMAACLDRQVVPTQNRLDNVINLWANDGAKFGPTQLPYLLFQIRLTRGLSPVPGRAFGPTIFPERYALPPALFPRYPPEIEAPTDSPLPIPLPLTPFIPSGVFQQDHFHGSRSPSWVGARPGLSISSWWQITYNPPGRPRPTTSTPGRPRVTPRPDNGVRLQPTSPLARRPIKDRRVEKEKKIPAKAAAVAAFAVFRSMALYSEINDFVSVAWKATPPRAPSRLREHGGGQSPQPVGQLVAHKWRSFHFWLLHE